MKIYHRISGEQIELRSVSALESLVRRLEAEERPLAYDIEVEGGVGSTLLNLMLPDFTPEEESALLRIFEAACERELRECSDSIKLCTRRQAELQGIQVIRCGKGGSQA